MSINPMYRTIENIVSTNCVGVTADMVKGKKLFQLAKYVTGKKKSDHTDYEIIKSNNWYNFDSYTLNGKKGFIRVSLEPLFQVIE